MNDKTTQEIRDYIATGSIQVGICALVISICALIAGGVCQFLIHTDVMVAIVAVSIAISCFIFFLISFVSYQKSNSAIQKLLKSGAIEDVKHDYLHGKHMERDRIIFGAKYIICKNMNGIYAYTEVRKLYEHVQKVNGAEASRRFIAQMKDGKEIPLALLSFYDNKLDIIVELTTLIKSKNPNVITGYR